MKKRLCLLLGIVLGVAPAVFGAPALGLKLGLNLANLDEQPRMQGFSYGIRPGLVIGGTSEKSLSSKNNVILRSELLYVMKGSWVEGDLLYMGIPVAVRTRVMVDEVVLAPFLVLRGPSTEVTPFFEFGPEMGLNIKHRIRTEVAMQGETITRTDNITDWSGTNFSLNFGAGLAVRAGKGEALFDLRYNLGLTDLYTVDGASDKTTGLQLLMAYNFTVPQR